MICVILISSIIFTFGFCWRLWLTYAFCQMVSMRQESGVIELHFNCHYKCTNWILNQVYFKRCWAYCRHQSSSYILFCMYPLCCPQPLCIHGNSCLHGSTTGNRQWLKQTGFWSSLWETYVHFCLLLTNESWDSIWIVSLLYWNEVPQERSTSFVDSYWVSWQFLAVLHLLLNSSQIHFVLWQFWTIICMVFRTILILHSLTQCCVVSCFFEFF